MGDGLGNDGFATRKYIYATGRRWVTNCTMMGTKFWRIAVGLRDDGYKSVDDRSCIERQHM